jgi:hypothetical protein
MKHDPRLIPVDEMCNTLQREIDATLWEDPTEDVSTLERELKWFLGLQTKGILYDTTW